MPAIYLASLTLTIGKDAPIFNVSLLISIVAVCISSAGFIFQHLYYLDRLSIIFEATGLPNAVPDAGSILFKITTGNSGTRPMMVKDVMFSLRQHSASGMKFMILSEQPIQTKFPLFVARDTFQCIQVTKILSHFQLGEFCNSTTGALAADIYLTMVFGNVAGETFSVDRKLMTYKWDGFLTQGFHPQGSLSSQISNRWGINWLLKLRDKHSSKVRTWWKKLNTPQGLNNPTPMV